MTTFDPDFIAAQRKLAEKATPRPWEWHNTDDAMSMNDYYITARPGPDVDLDADIGHRHIDIIAITLLQTPRFADEPNYMPNTEFIVAACNNYPAALDEIERLRQRVAELEDAVAVDDVEQIARNLAQMVQLNERQENEALKARVAELEEKLRWIPVGERLPDSWKDVLLAEECYAIAYIGCYQAPERLFRNENGFIVRPTHWMDLPALPYERKDGRNDS